MTQLAAPRSTEIELTETDVDSFIGFVSFLARNDLWDDARRALAAADIATVQVSSRPIRVIRALINEELLASSRLSAGGRRHALVIAECGCGVSTPGPGHPPQFPHGGGDAGTGPAVVVGDGSH